MVITTELWQANLIALVSAFLAIKVLRPIAIYFNLVDIPAGRKQHVGHIPLIGGLSIYLCRRPCCHSHRLPHPR